MAELADAADSKSAGTWYLGGSTPPPGTTTFLFALKDLQEVRARIVGTLSCAKLATGVKLRAFSSHSSKHASASRRYSSMVLEYLIPMFSQTKIPKTRTKGLRLSPHPAESEGKSPNHRHLCDIALSPHQRRPAPVVAVPHAASGPK